MKLLTNPVAIKKQFKTLMEDYNEYYWAIAWADFNFDLSKILVAKQRRIKKIIVGLSFYATHPDFLKQFYNHGDVKFITNENQGTFHPKVYLFKNSDTDWKLLMGSGNFKKSAFETNTEVFTLISSDDKNSDEVLSGTIDFINMQSRLAVCIDKSFVKEYIEKKSKVREYHPALPNKGKSKAVYDMQWNEYLVLLKKSHCNDNIILLDWVKKQFAHQPLFRKMDLDIRKCIAGFGNTEEEIPFGCFGTTKARGYFKNVVIERPQIIDRALKKIPSTGEVSKRDYYNFIAVFEQEFKAQELACATRLLCLWRPDYFVNFNGRNKQRLSKALKIKAAKVNYDTYWNLIVEPIRNSEWIPVDKVQSKIEKTIFNYRVALLDCIYYTEP